MKFSLSLNHVILICESCRFALAITGKHESDCLDEFQALGWQITKPVQCPKCADQAKDDTNAGPVTQEG